MQQWVSGTAVAVVTSVPANDYWHCGWFPDIKTGCHEDY